MKDAKKQDLRKQNIIRVATGIPQDSEGYNGQIQIRNTSFGVRLYVKINNKWTYTSLISS